MRFKNRLMAMSAASAGIVAGLLAGCDRSAPAAAGGAGGAAGGGMPPPLVEVATAEQKAVPVYIDGIGKTVALESVMVKPRIAGQIIERRFEDGAEIKKGQVLFVIDPQPQQAALLSAQAQLKQAQAQLQLANIELERYSAVAGTNAISKSDLDTRKNAVEVGNATVAAAEASVRTAQINLDFCTITSPIDGRAGSRMVDVGNVVKENETSLLSIQRINPIYADFTVNEQQLTDVRANMANGTLKTYVKLPTDSDAGRDGELTFLDNSVQDATGTIRLRATLKNDDAHFWPGQFVGVRLILKTLPDAILVPNSAQQLSQAGPFVFVVKSDQTAEMRPVVPGQMQGDHVVITSGLGAGEKVITDGQMMVRPGGPVRVGTGAPAAGQQGGGVPPTQATGDATKSAGDQPQDPARQAGTPAGVSQGAGDAQKPQPGKMANEGGR